MKFDLEWKVGRGGRKFKSERMAVYDSIGYASIVPDSFAYDLIGQDSLVRDLIGRDGQKSFDVGSSGGLDRSISIDYRSISIDYRST